MMMKHEYGGDADVTIQGHVHMRHQPPSHATLLDSPQVHVRMNPLRQNPSSLYLSYPNMPDTEDIFSDTLSLFNNGPLDEPPSEVIYGPIRSRIVSPLRHHTLSSDSVLMNCGF